MKRAHWGAQRRESEVPKGEAQEVEPEPLGKPAMPLPLGSVGTSIFMWPEHSSAF